MKIKLDLLAFGAHPDDVDACAGGTIIASVRDGMNVGIIDLTSGEDSETAYGAERVKEANNSAKSLGARFRENLNFPERDFINTKNEDIIAEKIRQYSPDIVMLPHWHDRHKGHRDASDLIERAIQTAKYSKLSRNYKAHKCKVILYYMIHYEFKPAFVFDVSDTHEDKMRALFCHKSQMLMKKNGTFSKKLIDPDFIDAWVARSRWIGYSSGFKYGEAFDMRRSPGIASLRHLLNLYR